MKRSNCRVMKHNKAKLPDESCLSERLALPAIFAASMQALVELKIFRQAVERQTIASNLQK